MFTVTSCCCGCSLKQGTIILMILTLVSCVVDFFTIFVDTANFIPAIFFLDVICALTCAFGLYGVNKEKPAYISPFLVYQLFSVLFLVFGLMLFLMVQSTYSMFVRYLVFTRKISPEVLTTWSQMNGFFVVAMLVLGILCALQAYFSVVVYSFLKQLRANLNEPTIFP